MKFKATLLVLISAMGIGTQALAEQITCALTDWKGARSQSDEIAISWTGTRFVVNMNNNKIRVSGGGIESLGWVATSAKRNNSFTTFTYKDTATEKDKSKRQKAQFDFRMYKSGKCSVYVKIGQYNPMIAEGRVK